MKSKKFFLFGLFVFLFSMSCSLARQEMAESYWYNAKSMEHQGRYLEAAKLYEKSAEIEKASGKSRLHDYSASLSSAASMYFEVGQFDKALEYYKKSLAIVKELGLELEVSKQLNNIGLIYSNWGRYKQAIVYHKQGLAIAEKFGRRTSVAVEYNNIGLNYLSLNQHDKALEYLKKSLAINRAFGIKDQIATLLNNIGLIYSDQNLYGLALKHYREALAINRKYGLEDGVAVQLTNIGNIYYYRGKFEMAIDYQQESLAINRKRGIKDGIALDLSNIGNTYQAWGKYDRAVKHLEESVKLTEELRLTAKGDIRRDYLASQIYTYQTLVSTYLKKNDVPNAFRTIEISRAKLLAERIAGSDAVGIIPDAEQVRNDLQQNEAVLIYANADLYDMVQIALTKSGISGLEISNENFIESAKISFGKPIQNMLSNQRSITPVKKQKDSLDLTRKADRISEKSDFENVINYYRHLLSNPNIQTGSGSHLNNETVMLSQLLYQFLIKPMEPRLGSIKQLTIIPDGILAFLPFETLIDEEGRYLAEKFEIKYAQSIGVTKLIQARNYQERKPMLAFGGAVYDDVSYDADMIDSGTQLALIEEQVHSDFASRSSIRNAYAALGAGAWGNLPGTLSEVKAIEKITPGGEIVTRDRVSEHYIKSLSEQGKLAQYQVLHFATHGLVVPAIPELSAIVLSQFKQELNDEDGYLRMGEISRLNIKADFVNLSACETGLGKIYGGEGVVGLTQSFLIAGANSLSVSLWQVADDSTSQFMVAMYNQVEQNKKTYSQAITDIKRRFIIGDFGEEYKKPYYWSPFVYYGE